MNSASRFSIDLLQIPGLSVGQFSGANASITLDADLRLRSIGDCPATACLSRGTALVAESGADTHLSWGRWTGGNATVHLLGISASLALSGQQGMHYLVGVPTASMPTSGTFQYNLQGATRPTVSDGSMAPGNFQATALVQFSTGLQTRIGLKGTVEMPAFTVGFVAPMSSNTANSLSMTGSSRFAGVLDTTISASPGAAAGSVPAAAANCPAGGCSVLIQGGFYGPAAAQMGLGYTVVGVAGGNRTISGVGVLQKGP